jgi:hypothetical protein
MEGQRLRRRREIEDQAIELGSERAELQGRLRKNAAAMTALLETAIKQGIPVEHFARLVGVRRQSLYRWRAEASQKTKQSRGGQR